MATQENRNVRNQAIEFAKDYFKANKDVEYDAFLNGFSEGMAQVITGNDKAYVAFKEEGIDRPTTPHPQTGTTTPTEAKKLLMDALQNREG